MMKALYFLLLSAAVAAERWRWPDGGASNPGKTISFGDTDNSNPGNIDNSSPGSANIDDKLLFNEESVKRHKSNEDSDGTIDSVPRCKCVFATECDGRVMPAECGAGKRLCCYKRQDTFDQQHHASSQRQPLRTSVNGLQSGGLEEDVNRYYGNPQNSNLRYSNSRLLGPISNHLRTFSESQNRISETNNQNKYVLLGPGGPTGNIGPKINSQNILVGPSGPTGNIGPGYQPNVLVGPGGPTGNIGPNYNRKDILVGPGGPTGNIGSNPNNKSVLVSPSGPTGKIGPNVNNKNVLVGPGGPTGNIGPTFQSNVLVGPGGPTGNLGPNYHYKDILVGPGGLTGILGPNQRVKDVLVGPGGPTGNIGPNINSNNVLPGGPNGNIGSRYQPNVLVGPGGPTGNIGPNYHHKDILVGPHGPTGNIGPNDNTKNVLVGPGGPTGNVGPGYNNKNVLVGPGGPTGNIGPIDFNKGILVGPGGPTGKIGPNQHHNGNVRREVSGGPDESKGDIRTNYRPQYVNEQLLLHPSRFTGFGGLNQHKLSLIGLGPAGLIEPNQKVLGIIVGPSGSKSDIGPNKNRFRKSSKNTAENSSNFQQLNNVQRAGMLITGFLLDDRTGLIGLKESGTANRGQSKISRSIFPQDDNQEVAGHSVGETLLRTRNGHNMFVRPSAAYIAVI